MYRRFKTQAAECKSIYIAPELFDIPVSVGDRTTTIQDSSMALLGTKFHVEGDAVRLKKKLKLGELLKMKAEAQGLEIVDDASLADKVYSYEWALTPTEVNKLLF